jgi:hypothetical protein
MLEDRVHFPGQAQHDRKRRTCARIRCRFENALHLGLVDEGDHRRHAHTHRHTRLGERRDGLQAAVRRGGARLEDACERGVERGHRAINGDQPLRRHRRDEVEVAFDARRLGDQRKRMAAFVQHLDHRARDAELALDRLVGIGGGADVEHLRLVARCGQRFAQFLGRVHLGNDLGLEVEPRRHVEVAVGRPREAVDAAVLAAAVRVDRDVEVNVGRIVARQNRLDTLFDDLRGGR